MFNIRTFSQLILFNSLLMQEVGIVIFIQQRKGQRLERLKALQG